MHTNEPGCSWSGILNCGSGNMNSRDVLVLQNCKIDNLRFASASESLSINFSPPFKKRNSFRVFPEKINNFSLFAGVLCWECVYEYDALGEILLFHVIRFSPLCTQNVTSQQVVLLCKKYRFLLLVALYIMFVSCSSTQPSSSRRYIHGAFFLNTTWTQRESVCSMLSGKL